MVKGASITAARGAISPELAEQRAASEYLRKTREALVVVRAFLVMIASFYGLLVVAGLFALRDPEQELETALVGIGLAATFCALVVVALVQLPFLPFGWTLFCTVFGGPFAAPVLCWALVATADARKWMTLHPETALAKQIQRTGNFRHAGEEPDWKILQARARRAAHRRAFLAAGGILLGVGALAAIIVMGFRPS